MTQAARLQVLGYGSAMASLGLLGAIALGFLGGQVPCRARVKVKPQSEAMAVRRIIPVVMFAPVL